MPKKVITFSGGIQSPPKLGTVILKPATEGKMSYAQNISVSTDKYGNGVLVPGMYMAPLASNITNPIYWKAAITQNIGGKNGQMWVGYNGLNTLDYIKGINSGSGPAFETSGTVTINVSGHLPILSDIESGPQLAAGAGNMFVYAALNETTTGTAGAWIATFSAAGGVTTQTLTAPGVVNAIPNPLPMIRAQFDGNFYIGNGPYIDKINIAASSLPTATVLKAVGTSSSGAIPNMWNFTAMGEWNGKLVGAANNEAPGDFSKRNGGGQSRVFFWDISNAPTANYLTNFVNSPSHYISVLFTDLSGNLLAFGGVDEGRTTIYQYNGYGFLSLFSYIGDMPRNRHSVCFDAQGRLMWQTADGQICRLDLSQLSANNAEEQSGAFEHLTTIIGASGTGGILGNLQAGGDEFVASGSTYLTASNINLFTGDVAGYSGAYTTNTPVAISGIENFSQKSIIRVVTLSLNKALQQAESIDVNYYPQGTTILQGINLGNMSYANDGAVASKNFRTFATQVDMAAFGVAWRTATGTTTVPGVIQLEVEYKEITTL